MFRISATVGRRLWKLRSNSHASATNARPAPDRLPVPPSCGAVPPTTKLGSTPQAMRAWAIMAGSPAFPLPPGPPAAPRPADADEVDPLAGKPAVGVLHNWGGVRILSRLAQDLFHGRGHP